jgi:hypothetical protein
MDADYAAFVHVRGSQGHLQGDYVLGPVGHPTRTWQPGEIVKQTELLTLPQELPLGSYDIDIGVWDPTAHHHLRIGPWWHPAKSARLLTAIGVSQPVEAARSRGS